MNYTANNIVKLFIDAIGQDAFRDFYVEEGDGFEDDPDAYEAENIFFVPPEARWSEIAKAAHTPEIGTILDKAMIAIEADNKSLKGVLPKNYANPELDKRVLGNVVDVFTNMDMSDTEASKDLLGRTYEYCIAQSASYEGVKGGEFYTPASVVKTIVNILKPSEGKLVYDPCCGSGGMFVQSVKFIQEHAGNRSNISVFGQEANADTWKMAKMNMAIRGIDANFGDHPEDTFFNDLHSTQKFDFIMANPPFNLSNWGQNKLQNDPRWAYGLPPAGNANYAWIEHMIYHLASNGKIGLVLANGALSTQTSGEGEIRRKIIEADLIEGIVAMPPPAFLQRNNSGNPLVHHPRQKADRQNPLHRCPQHGPHGRPQAPRLFRRRHRPPCQHLHRLPERHPRRCKRLLRSCHHKTNRRPELHPHPRPLRWHRRKSRG